MIRTFYMDKVNDFTPTNLNTPIHHWGPRNFTIALRRVEQMMMMMMMMMLMMLQASVVARLEEAALHRSSNDRDTAGNHGNGVA